jgi:hypothetical protein
VRHADAHAQPDSDASTHACSNADADPYTDAHAHTTPDRPVQREHLRVRADRGW